MSEQVADASDIFAGAEDAQLAQAACAGDRSSAAAALSAGANPKAVGRSELTVLGFALSCESPEGLRLLLENGADPNQRTDDGLTPMLVAAEYADPALISTLMDAGGDINARSVPDGRSVLQAAYSTGTRTGSFEVYRLLLDRGADINSDHPDGGTIAVFVVAVFGDYEEALALLDRGYTHDLAGLLAIAKARQVAAGSPAAEAKERLIERLESEAS